MLQVESLFLSGRIAEIVLVITLVEMIGLIAWQRWKGTGPKPVDVIIGLAPGVFLVLALHAALVGAPWTHIALALVGSLIAHLTDLVRRWPTSR
jgi:hypothetical protein